MSNKHIELTGDRNLITNRGYLSYPHKKPNIMKYLITFLVGLLAGVWIYDIAGRADGIIVSKHRIEIERNDARYWEKSRWANYELDSLEIPALMIDMQYLVDKDALKAKNAYRELVFKANVPFTNDKKFNQ